MVALEVLQAQSADDVPLVVFIVDAPHQSVGILLQPLLAHPVGTFHAVDSIIAKLSVGQSQFLDFVLGAELFIVAVAMRVVQRCRCVPSVADGPGSREDVVVLPEVVGGLRPVRAVAHRVTLGQVVAVGVTCKVTVGIVGQLLVERVVAAQSHLVEVFISLDAGIGAIGAVHQREIVVAGSHTVPRLSGLLEVTDVFVAQLEVVAHPRQSTIVRARAAAGAVDKPVGIGLVIGSVEDEVVPQQTRREFRTHIKCVERTVACRQFQTGCLLRNGRREGHCTAKGTVSVG